MTAAAPVEVQTLIDDLLWEQQRLTAVERFASQHERHALPAHAQLYRELLPLHGPGPGEQFAFAVDLDACSGCKSCVAACHSLNGLDEAETWRSVGLLHGLAADGGFQQTVTTACHHCVDPACLNGCPVLAYEKDPITGIVRHLDDQCIGCQYCILKCPYDVPQYSRKRGIVRKCDMCASRLAVNEAPACAQACPNGAIRITVVSQAAVVVEAKAGNFLPGAPHPAYTQPTTRYHTERDWPTRLDSADSHVLKPGHPHLPLVVMLVLSQLSVGAFCVELVLRILFRANLMTQLSAWHALAALALGLLALGTSTLHLGRPLSAWRAVIGLKTSWLSREIVVFGWFAGLACLQAAGFWVKRLHAFSSLAMGTTVALSGLLGVVASVMIYHDTRRPLWSVGRSASKFFGTTALLGTATIMLLTTLQGLLWPQVARDGAYHELTYYLATALAAISSLKLGLEATIYRHLHSDKAPLLKRTARLMSGELSEISTVRFLIGILGGVFLPLVFLFRGPAPGVESLALTVCAVAFTVVGELLERYLFFAAAVPARMPGGIGP